MINYAKNVTIEQKERLYSDTLKTLEKYPTHIPVLIQINSNVLRIEKNKYLVPKDFCVGDYVSCLKKKIIGLNSSDTLVICPSSLNNDFKNVKRITESEYSKSFEKFYDEHKDTSTGMLVLVVSRLTTYKWVKSVASYYMGY